MPKLLILLLACLAACSTVRREAVWPELRPLGRDLKTYRPPDDPDESAPAQLGEPKGALTLREVLAMTLLGNPGLAAFSLEVRAGEARALQASLLPNPEIEIVIEEFAGSGERKGFDGAQTTLQLSQLIETGGKRDKRTRVASLRRDLAGWDYETKRLDVLTMATKAFVGVLAAQDRLALAEDLVRLAERVRGAAAERVRTGKVSPIERTRAEVALSTSRIAREKAERGLAAARKRLAAAWGSAAPSFERVVGELEKIGDIPPLDDLAGRIVQNPDIARWDLELEERRASVEMEESRWVPDLTMSAGVQRFEGGGDTALVVGMSLPIPLFDRNQGGTLEARYGLAKAGRERRAAEIRNRAALAEVYEILRSSHMEAASLKEDVLPGAQSAFDSIREGFRQGKFGYLDVLDAQRTLFEVKGQYLDALTAFHEAAAEVERLVGEGLAAVMKTGKRTDKENKNDE